MAKHGSGTDLPGTGGRRSTGLNKIISPIAESDGREPFGQRNRPGVNPALDLNDVDTLAEMVYGLNPKQKTSK